MGGPHAIAQGRHVAHRQRQLDAKHDNALGI